MIAEAGHFALILALFFTLMQSIYPFIGYFKNDQNAMMSARANAVVQFMLIAFAFAMLITSFATSDFSVALVQKHSYSLQPLIYKISATWGNHEGSMLMWVFILTLFSALVAIFGVKLPLTLQSLVLVVQGWISFTFTAFIIFTSNPFIRLSPAPIEGRDLNPILQDFGLAIHPPLLYCGYVGFSVAFSFAVAALIEGKIDNIWARWVRPWTLLAWMFLTLGIAMGSWWAYYELGWGGFWFWDPVENASFLPWLTGTALLHSAIVMEKRNALKSWTILLAIITFSMSLLGTFLVRSGVLTSVHAFASDPTRGIVILCILLVTVAGALSLYVFRAKLLTSQTLFQPISREGGLIINNLLLTAIMIVVFVGTLYPMIIEAINGSRISVGAPFFNLASAPLAAMLAIIIPFGPMLAWKRADLLGAAQRLAIIAFLAFCLGLLLMWRLDNDTPVLASFGLILGIWLIFGAIYELLYRAKLGSVPVNIFFKRLFGLPRSAFGAAFGHMGVGISVIGVIAVTSFQHEVITVMEPEKSVDVGGYEVRFDGVSDRAGPNYHEEYGQFIISKGGSQIAALEPSKRTYRASRQNTTEAGILHLGLSQLFITLGDPKNDGAYAVTLFYKPLVSLIWGGAAVMVLGGFLSLMDRRLRIGISKRVKKMPDSAQKPSMSEA